MLAAVDCGRPSVPLNGGVDYLETVFLSMAYYACDNGYLLAGERNRSCEASAMWSGDEPECKG